MPLSLNQLDTITHEWVRPQIADNVFNGVPLLARLERLGRTVLEGGSKIREPLTYQATGQAGGFDGDGPLPISMNELITGAEFLWVTYQSPVVFSRLEEAKNSGRTGILKIVEQLRSLSEMDLRDKIGGDAVVGNDATSETTELDGLELMVDDDDSPKNYGDIATTNFSGWKADDTALSAALTLFDMHKMVGRVTKGSDGPTLILMSQAEFDKMWSLLQADQRYSDQSEASAGFKSLMFSGIPVMVDPNVPEASATSHTMYALNEKYIKLYTHSDWNFRARPFQEPEDQWSAISHFIWMGQLTSNNRRMHARLSGVDPS